MASKAPARIQRHIIRLSPYEVVASMEKMTLNLVRLDPAEVRRRRACFNANWREIMDTHIDAPIYFERHHIVPLSLSGANSDKNLVKVDPELHQAIHDFIDPQMSGMKLGQRKAIRVPIRRCLVWDLRCG